MAVEVSPTGQIQEFVAVLKRRRWQILLPTMFVLLLGTVFAVIVPKKFVIKTEIELRENNLRAAEDKRQRKESPLDREIPVLESHIRNFSRIAGIVERSGDAWPNYLQADRAHRHTMIEGMIRNLKVDATTPKEGSAFFNIDYRDVDAARGEKFLAEVVKVATEDILNADRLRLQDEINSVQTTYDEIKESTNRARREWASFAQDEGLNPARAPGTSSRDEKSKYERIEDRLTYLTGKLGDMERNKNDLELHIEQMEEDLLAMPATTLVAAETELPNPLEIKERLLAEEARLTTAETKLAAYQPGTRRHEEWKVKRDKAKERIALANSLMAQAEPEMREISNEAFKTLSASLDDARDALERNGESQVLLQADIAAAQRSQDSLAVLLEQAQTLYDERVEWELELKEAKALLSEKNSALRQAKLFTREVILNVAKPAFASETAEDPNPYLIIGFCLFAGLGLGLAIALLTEYAGNSYRTVADLASVMNVPVIGSTGTIVTRGEARRSFGVRLLVGVPSLVIVAGVSWMTYTWADADTRQSLPVPVQQAIEGLRINLMNM